MSNTYEIKYGDDYITVSAEVEKAIDEANDYCIKETGVDISDFLYDCAGSEAWRFFDEDSAEYADEDIIGIIWNEAENFVDFNKTH